MVRGQDIFKKYFEQYSENYVIIGGTACDIIINDAGFIPRATKDIDIILVVEALTPEFVKQFWEFIKDGKYKRNEIGNGDRKYYRFIKPENMEFPFQIELFSRVPDLLDFDEETHLTPIPVDDDLSSLSAILMNEDYYNYTIEHSKKEDGINVADLESLICLKAKAFLEMTERKFKGESIDKRNINKHKTDIFRLAIFLNEDNRFVLPKSIHNDMQSFVENIKNDLPNKAIFKEMGLGNTDNKQVFEQLVKSFNLE